MTCTDRGRQAIARLSMTAFLFSGATSHNAQAFEFALGEIDAALTSKITLGAGWRVEDRDDDLIGKLNIPGQQTLCLADDCLSLSGDPEPNQRLVDARGDFAAHVFDDGNLNYDKGDPIAGLVKLKSSLTMRWQDVLLKVSGIGFYDKVNYHFTESHPNTLLQPAHTARSKEVEKRVGARAEIREAYANWSGLLGDRLMSVSVGAQKLRWGEANMHPLNTLDEINPKDAILPQQPGLAIDEISIPTDMAVIAMDLISDLSIEAFYQYRWEPARPPPQGSYFSSADIIGGTHLIAAPGQFAEDPQGAYDSPFPVNLLTNDSRRVLISEGRAADDGQFGIRLNGLSDFNGGTEFSLYFANYHSRLPYLSIYETAQSCLRRAAVPGNFTAAWLACTNATGSFNGTLQTSPSLDTEPLPVSTARGLLAYPQDIQLFGLSFNTTVLGWAIAGEYAYRPNLPAQILVSDLLFAGAQQAFPTQDIPILASDLPGIAGTTIPGARTFLPDFVSEYRGRTMANNREYQPGEFIPGWERLEMGQFVVNALKLLRGHFGSDQIIVLLEAGFTHVIDMPQGLYFQGVAKGSHPGPAAEGTGPGEPTTLRLNPTVQTDGFAEDFAWGLRGLVQLSYSNLFGLGLNLNPTLLWFEDIKGTSPFPMQNYVEGNRWITGSLMIQYLQNIEASLSYMHYDGPNNVLRDRDNVQLSLSYSF